MPPGLRINGITALCWDFPCDGFRLLTTAEGHIAARIGFGLQETPTQFLAMLALGAVPADYPVRCGTITARWRIWSNMKNSIARPGPICRSN